MSYLSPLPHYPATRDRARDWRSHSVDRELQWTEMDDSHHRLHRHLLLHPLYAQPRRFYSLAGGHQPIVTWYPARQHLRRPRPPAPVWTVRQYSTQPLVCARPVTTNRYEVTNRIYPMDEWTDRINVCLDEIGRTARSMNRWNEIKPERRFMLRPMVPISLCRSATFINTPIR